MKSNTGKTKTAKFLQPKKRKVSSFPYNAYLKTITKYLPGLLVFIITVLVAFAITPIIIARIELSQIVNSNNIINTDPLNWSNKISKAYPNSSTAGIVNLREFSEAIPPEKEIKYIEKLPEKESVIIDQGEQGTTITMYYQIFIKGKLSTPIKHTVSNSPAKKAVMLVGTTPLKNLSPQIVKDAQNLISALLKKNLSACEQLLTEKEKSKCKELSKISTLNQITKFTFKEKLPLLYNEELVEIGTVTLQAKNCSAKTTLTAFYNPTTDKYQFSNTKGISTVKCVSQNFVTTFTCSNCWLAPVSKKQRLSSSYTPYVIATGVTGGGYVTPEAKSALKLLFADAKSKSIPIMISSSYRSYKTQASLFEMYVQAEMRTGLSRSEAEKKANTYSAKPGHSEHQLGTTVDVKACPSCGYVKNPENVKLYNYLKGNAHKFGFAISYVEHAVSKTGYQYEPWHIRYIGVTYATELYNRGYINGGTYLEQFLREKGKY